MLYLYLRAMNWLQKPRDKGQTLVEYALIIVLIAILLIVALTTLSSQISDAFADISSGLGKR